MKLIVICLTIFMMAAFLSADESTMRKPQVPTIRVSGDATISVAPDQATMNMGVVTRATNAAAAASQNAAKLDRVLTEVKKVLGSNGEIKTTQYSLSPNYVYPPQGGEPKLNGYTASNTVEIKTDHLDLVGKLIDAGTQAGSNAVDLLSFSLKDETAAQAQALKEATRRARAKADAIAEALNVKIQRIVQVEESSSGPIPLQGRQMMMKAQAEDVQTPIEAGKIEVQANVTLTVEVQ